MKSRKNGTATMTAIDPKTGKVEVYKFPVEDETQFKTELEKVCKEADVEMHTVYQNAEGNLLEKGVGGGTKEQLSYFKDLEKALDKPEHYKRVYLLGVAQNLNYGNKNPYPKNKTFIPGGPQYLKVGITSDLERRLKQIQTAFDKKPLPKDSRFGRWRSIEVLGFGLPSLIAHEVENIFRIQHHSLLVKGKKDWYHGNRELTWEAALSSLQSIQTGLENQYQMGLIELDKEKLSRLHADPRNNNDVFRVESVG